MIICLLLIFEQTLNISLELCKLSLVWHGKVGRTMVVICSVDFADVLTTLFSEQKGSRQSCRRHTGSRHTVPTGSGFFEVMWSAGRNQSAGRRTPVPDKRLCTYGTPGLCVGREPESSCRRYRLQPAGKACRHLEDCSHSEAVGDHQLASIIGRLRRQIGHVRRHECCYWRTLSGKPLW